MKIDSNRDKIHIGRSAGDSLLKDMRQAKESVKIVSPYLTPSYIEELIRLQKKGVNVTLITSDNLEEGDGRYSDLEHRDIIKQKQEVIKSKKEKRTKGMRWAGIPLLLSIILFVNQAIGLGFIFFIISLAIFFIHYNIKIYNYSYYSIFNLRVFHSKYNYDKNRRGTHDVHAKIYVIDNKIAYVGSINFTHAGLSNNYETAVEIKDQKAIKAISEEINVLFNSKRYFMPIDEWGQELYDEPSH